MPGGPGTAARASSRNVALRSLSPRTCTAPPATTRSAGAASSSSAATLTIFSRTLRAARSAAGKATDAPRLARAVAVDHRDPLGRDIQLVGHDLGQRRVDALTDGGDTGIDHDVAGPVDLDPRIFPR